MKNKMKKGLKIVLLIGLSVLISYCMIDLRRGTSALSFLQGFLLLDILIDPSAFFIFTILCLWKLRLNNPRSTALLIAIGSSIIEIIGILYATILYGEWIEDIHPPVSCGGGNEISGYFCRLYNIYPPTVVVPDNHQPADCHDDCLDELERCGFHLRLSDFQELEGPRNSNNKVPARYPERSGRGNQSCRFQRFVSASRLLDYQLRRMLPGVSNSAGTL